MPLTEIQGDLFESPFINDANTALGHGVNCKGVMGAGIAVEFKKRYPLAYQSYRAHCKYGATPGDTQLWGDVFHLFIKDDWRDPSEFEWVESAVSAMDEIACELEIKRICIPRIACGLGGLSWELVKPLFEACKTEIVCYY